MNARWRLHNVNIELSAAFVTFFTIVWCFSATSLNDLLYLLKVIQNISRMSLINNQRPISTYSIPPLIQNKLSKAGFVTASSVLCLRPSELSSSENNLYLFK